MSRTAEPIRRIAIVGGGTAGWIAASILARTLGPAGMDICLVESPEIGTVGVGEATIPPIIDLLRMLGIDEADFIRHTSATYKLGIKFTDWRKPGASYWHPFGGFGAPIANRPFANAFLTARSLGLEPRHGDYSACIALAEAGNCLPPGSPGSDIQKHALHFDAGLVAQYLSAYARRLGVRRIERTVNEVRLDDRGFISGLLLSDGQVLRADLYLDCSGFRGLLIEGALQTGYTDWRAHLPCDRAIAAPTARRADLAPYTLSAARNAGWRWRIPLQSRTGNGHVYASAYMDDQTALDDLLACLGEEPLAEPRVLRFVTGRRNLFWNRNCIALGLASGFLEPLESTSIQLVINGVFNLLDHFPDTEFEPRTVQNYNDELIREMETIRDFIILHYCATERQDTAFWRDRRAQVLPDSLAARIELYRASGRIRPRPGELFTDLSWFWVLDGMGLAAERTDPMLDVVPPAQLAEILRRLCADTQARTRTAPPHAALFASAPSTPPRAGLQLR